MFSANYRYEIPGMLRDNSFEKTFDDFQGGKGWGYSSTSWDQLTVLHNSILDSVSKISFVKNKGIHEYVYKRNFENPKESLNCFKN